MNIFMLSLLDKEIKRIHKNCVYYQDGLCTLNRVVVDPDSPACPSFVPRSLGIVDGGLNKNFQNTSSHWGQGLLLKNRGRARLGRARRRRKGKGVRS